jgi:hypothetical protein
MRKLFVLFLICFSSAFANDISSQEHHDQKSNFTYLKIAGSLIPLGSDSSLAPSLILGRRFQMHEHAIDVSTGGGRYSNHRYFFFPKIMYLYYFTPDMPTSFYAGGGLSCGIIRNKADHKKFKGVLGEMAVGYEWFRTTSIRSFVELNLSESALPLSDKSHYMPPVASLGFGVGF